MERLDNSPARLSAPAPASRPSRLSLVSAIAAAALLRGHRAHAAESTDSAQSTAPALAASNLGEWTSSVSLVEEYRLRRASHALAEAGQLGETAAVGDQQDHRLRLHSDARVDGVQNHFRALFSGAMWWDLDGAQAQGTTNLFASQYDASSVWAAPYVLSAEWREAGVLDHFRVGRQDTDHGLPLTFDGASLGVRPMGQSLLLYGFAGQTVHFFETTPGLLENWVASTGAALHPTPWLQFEFDARLVRERKDDSVEADGSELTTHSYGLSAATRTDFISARAQLRGLDEQVSHAAGAMSFALPEAGFGVDARTSAQLVTLGEVAASENPYFSLLGPSLPHARHRFEVWKELEFGDAGRWTNHLGWQGRQLIGHGEQPFNRNSGSIYLQTRIDDLVQRGLFLGGVAEYNYVPTAPDEAWLLTVGGAVGYDDGALRTEVGTDYQRFKINYYQRAEELHDARTVYASVGFRALAWLELRGRYELEIVDRYLESFYLTVRQDF